jgi:N-acetyltransferase 10
MPRKKVDARVRTIIENGVKSRTRTLLVLVGDRGKDQVVNLHYILSKAQVKARPRVLWCYQKELGFSTSVITFSLGLTLPVLWIILQPQAKTDETD